MSGLSAAAIFSAVDLARINCVSRHVSTVQVGTRGTRFIPFERITAYIDDRDAQCRTVLEVAVTLAPNASKRRKAREKQMTLRIARLHGFDAKRNCWGRDSHESENLPWDAEMPYEEAFAYAGKLLDLARSEAFAEYEKTGTFFRRH